MSFAQPRVLIVLTCIPAPTKLCLPLLKTCELASNQNYDLVILDLTLPGAPGLDVLRGIRSIKPDLPVLIIMGATKVEERVRGLDAGADDYVLKPFVFAELSARIPAVLRRARRPARAVLQIADLELERVSHEVQRGGHEIALNPKEYARLNFSCATPGSPFPTPRFSSKSGSLIWTT